jgi:hypothetical protein
MGPDESPATEGAPESGSSPDSRLGGVAHGDPEGREEPTDPDTGRLRTGARTVRSLALTSSGFLASRTGRN